MVPDFLLKLSGIAPLQLLRTGKLENIMINVNDIIKYSGIGFMLIMTIAVAAV